MHQLQTAQIEELRTGFAGQVLSPGEAGFDEARKIWNAMIDKRPAIIARCATTADVVRALVFARRHSLPLAVRGGGHNIAGSALCDDGLVVDLSLMREVRVDAAARRAIVEAGATLSEVDAATQTHGLATPVGINSTTGIAGLTLGGGFGWLSRAHGMTVDNLEAVEVVTAAGQVLRASAQERADLFWALRGGGGNFGIVTRFEFRLHKVGPQLLSGLIVHAGSDAKVVMQRFRAFVTDAPDELSVWAVLRHAPPLPFLPESVHGRPVVVLAFLYAGSPERGQPLIEALREIGTPVGEHIGVQPYTAWQQAFDPLLTPGARNYWKSHNLTELDDRLLDLAARALQELPTPQCELFLASLGGATARPAPDAMAYANRDARFVLNLHARWEDAADDRRCIDWARALFDATTPFATGGVYVNFLTADESDRVRAAYGPNYPRLVQLKQRWDPENLFRANQNIPAV